MYYDRDYICNSYKKKIGNCLIKLNYLIKGLFYVILLNSNKEVMITERFEISI